MHNIPLHHIADRALNRPLLITPGKAQIIAEVLGGRIGLGSPVTEVFPEDPSATRFRGAGRGVPTASRRRMTVSP